MAFKLKKRTKTLLSSARVLHEILNLPFHVVLQRNVPKFITHLWRRAEKVLLITPFVLSHSRCRRRRLFKGLFTLREEGPRTTKILEDGRTFRLV